MSVNSKNNKSNFRMRNKLTNKMFSQKGFTQFKLKPKKTKKTLKKKLKKLSLCSNKKKSKNNKKQ